MFPTGKDRPILFTALAWSQVLLTLDRQDFIGLLGGTFYGLRIRPPFEFLEEERAAGRLLFPPDCLIPFPLRGVDFSVSVFSFQLLFNALSPVFAAGRAKRQPGRLCSPFRVHPWLKIVVSVVRNLFSCASCPSWFNSVPLRR